MAISIGTQTNIDKSNLAAYPNGQILDNTGPGTGTPIICVTASDIWMFFDKLMREAQLPFNTTFDNETNGYQFVQACAALASKSDFVLPITTVTGVLQIPINLDILKLNEKLICQAAADWTVETQIKGSTATLLTVTITRRYKANDYLMLIRTSGGVQLISLATADNLNVLVNELNYLKAATNSDETIGTSVDKATTPASNLFIFTKRVTDPTAAAPFLATTSTPGLLSAAQWNLIQNFVNPVKNVGSFAGLDVGGGTVGQFLTVTGDLASAEITFVAGDGSSSHVLVTMDNAMTGTNYFVRMHVQSEGTIGFDINVLSPVFVPLSSTTFTFAMDQSNSGGIQSLKIHCEVVQL